MKYRKKPIEIEAVQITQKMTVETLEGPMTGNPGDWLITGVKGEHYFCKDDIFKATYDIVIDDNLVYIPPQINYPNVQPFIGTCFHEYPFPWNSTTPPPCKKCGYTPPSGQPWYIITSTT